MNAVWPDLLLIAVLVLLNAFFAASEIAVIAAREQAPDEQEIR